MFIINYTMQLKGDSTRAGFVLGANDPRLNDWTKNNYLVEGENYIYVELDATGLRDNDPDTAAVLNIWRKGYCTADYQQKDNTSLVTSVELKDSVMVLNGVEYAVENDVGLTEKNINDPIDVRLVNSGNNIGVTVNGVALTTVGVVRSWRGESVQTLDYFIVNPTGAIQDVPCFPRLNDIGFGVGKQDAAVFTNVSVRHYNQPNSVVFGKGVGATYSIFDRLKGVTVSGDEITVVGAISDNNIVYADPSYGSTPMLRKEFSTDREIERARLYVTARGIYEMYINGERVGNDWFSPGYTQYDKTINYVAYDVTNIIQPGTNAIGALLASGWWSDQMTFSLSNHNFWGDRQSLLAKLEITYKDGSTKTVVTDPAWKYFGDGPIVYAGFFNGEEYDARKEVAVDGWGTAAYDDSAWDYADQVLPLEQHANPRIVVKVDEPVRIAEEILGTYHSQPKAGEDVHIYDMGVNMVGVPQVKLPEMKAGQVITFRFAETLYPELNKDNPYCYGDLAGMILTENLRGAYVTDTYIAKGTPGGEIYTPRFTFHGYRYIEISGAGGVIPDGDVKVWFCPLVR